jgi:methylmalonyl-CoA/ethylmalonyl-CoA epimerase
VAFYQSSFSGRLLHQEENSEQGVIEAMVALGTDTDSDTGTVIQLLAPLTPESTIARFIDKNGPGMQQLALRVLDVEDAASQAQALGIRTLYESPKRGTNGARINFLHPKDCGGVLIELIERSQSA